MPRFDLVDASRYHAMTIQFSRGCPFRCEFCDIIVVYGRKPRTKAVHRLIAEVEACLAAGARQVFIVDDNFAGNKRLARELLTALAEWSKERNYPIDFNAEVSLDVAEDAELLRLMREANFTTVFVGIESPNAAALTEAKKTQNTRARHLREPRQDLRPRHPGAGGHDRRLRRRQHRHLRPAVRLQPAGPHPHRDGGHVAGRRGHAAVLPGAGRGPPDPA